MKKWLTLLIFCALLGSVYAQSYYPDKVDKKAAALYTQAISSAEAGNFKDGINFLDKAIQQDSRNPNFYDNRGNVWRNKGRFDRAVEDYDKAIALAPNFALAFFNRSQAHYLAGRFSQALADADKAAALNGNSAAAFSLRGLIREKLGARDDAIADLRQAAALDPTFQQPTDALRRLGAAVH